MTQKRNYATTSLFLLFTLPAFSHPIGEELTYLGRPLAGNMLAVATNQIPIVFETPLSDPIQTPFDTVLFQGTLPQENISIEIGIANPNKQEDITWYTAQIKVFANGRFWGKVKFNAPQTGSLKLRASSQDPKISGPITIYSIEVFKEESQRETYEQPAYPEQRPSETPPNKPKPLIHERGFWKAKEPKEPYESHKPYRFTQHHTAGKRTFKLEDSIIDMQLIQEFHQEGRGWKDIGYHFVIDGEGRIFEGRPIEAIGAHVKNNNLGNIGVSFMGYYHPPFNNELNEKQIEAVLKLYAWLSSSCAINPDTLKGHRDYKRTHCPGDLIYPLLESIRTRLKTLLAEILTRFSF